MDNETLLVLDSYYLCKVGDVGVKYIASVAQERFKKLAGIMVSGQVKNSGDGLESTTGSRRAVCSHA